MQYFSEKSASRGCPFQGSLPLHSMEKPEKAWVPSQAHGHIFMSFVLWNTHKHIHCQSEVR